MNCLDDQTLMAYADGELDAAGRLQVEQALAADANLAARVRAHQALRRRVAAAYDPELQDTVPERLLRAAAPPTAPLLDLAGARAARAASRAPGSRHALAGWARWGGLAACLVLGLALGTRLQQSGTEESVYASAGAGLVARGALARALDGQAAGAAGPSAVAVSLSFVDRGGRYCRAYTLQGSAALACREGTQWVLQTLEQQPAAPAGELRQAASALPPALLQAIDQRIAGTSLDARAERAAIQGGWRR